MDKSDDPAYDSTHGVTPGHENASAPGPVKDNGQNSSYWVLSDAERAKGFVRPVRTDYVHTGLKAPGEMRPLTDDEAERHAGFDYVAFEPSTDPESAVTGTYWTQARLDRVGAGCGSRTIMARAIAETYARDPSFYGSTFCMGCKVHLAVAEFVWDGTEERVGS